MRSFLFYSFIIFTLFFCQNAHARKTKKAKKLTAQDVVTLYNLMKGSYSSQAQSVADTTYFDIRLQMKPMWQGRQGKYYLYVEQAMSSNIEKPYRQRVYELKLENDTTISSTVYTIKGGEKFYGDWKKDAPLQNVAMDSLESRKGCAIYLHKYGKNKYAGSTNKNDCESSLRGATYATSEVKISKKKVLSWDRGWDKTDKQVWGAVKAGYNFLKLQNNK